MPSLLAAAAALVLLAGCTDGGDPAATPPEPTTTTTTATTATPAPAPTTTTTAGPPAWRARAQAPTARQEVASAVLDGKVWVVGGLTAAGASATVESYDPATDRWAAGPDLPIALHHLAAATFRGELVVIGGFGAGGSDLYSRPSDRVFALRGGQWTELARLRRPRGAAAAAVTGDRLYLAGGRDSNLLIQPTEVFDGTSWQDRAAIPTPRDHLGMATDGDGRLYAVGGRYLSPARTSNDAERYDPARDTWERVAPLPTARGGLGVTFVGNQLVAAGGEDAAAVFPQVEAFDPSTGTWTSLPALPTPRHGLALSTVGPAAFALVGGTQAGVAPSAAAEALGPG